MTYIYVKGRVEGQLGPRVGFLVRTLLFVVVDSANIYSYFLYAMRGGGGKIVLTIFMILASTLSSSFFIFRKNKMIVYLFIYFFKVTD